MHPLVVIGLWPMWRRVPAFVPRAHRSMELLFVLGGLLVSTGCWGNNPTTAGNGSPQISADPNPVPAGSEKFGKTTISWDTGNGSIGEVYVSVNGAPDKLFAGNRAKSSKEVSWIGKGQHEFKLYAGKAHEKLLASVTVTRLRN